MSLQPRAAGCLPGAHPHPVTGSRIRGGWGMPAFLGTRHEVLYLAINDFVFSCLTSRDSCTQPRAYLLRAFLSLSMPLLQITYLSLGSLITLDLPTSIRKPQGHFPYLLVFIFRFMTLQVAGLLKVTSGQASPRRPARPLPHAAPSTSGPPNTLPHPPLLTELRHPAPSGGTPFSLLPTPAFTNLL